MLCFILVWPTRLTESKNIYPSILLLSHTVSALMRIVYRVCLVETLLRVPEVHGIVWSAPEDHTATTLGFPVGCVAWPLTTDLSRTQFTILFRWVVLEKRIVQPAGSWRVLFGNDTSKSIFAFLKDVDFIFGKSSSQPRINCISRWSLKEANAWNKS